MPTRINFGCGQKPTPGWINYDNSPSVLLSRSGVLVSVSRALGFIDRHNADFIAFCRANRIGYANASTRLPHETGSVDVVYSAHMLEHLFREDAEAFLRECHRVLRPGGVLRLAVPDLARDVEEYLAHGDANKFLSGLEFDLAKPQGWRDRLRRAFLGSRGHRWYYDRRSLSAVAAKCGFVDIGTVEPGVTRIEDYGDLDLYERSGQGWYLEASRP